MTTINLPIRWPWWVGLIGIAMSAALAAGGFAAVSTGAQAAGEMSLVFAVLVALVVVILHAATHYLGRVAAEGYRRVKLERLAADNGLSYLQRGRPPELPGCVFTTGTFEPYVHSEFATATSPRIRFGNFRPVSKAGDGPSSSIAPSPAHSWGFLAIPLHRTMPHLLLVSTTRKPGEMTLPITPDGAQTLSLEGDFDKYFTLYCPKEFEQQALYVLTPDLMALLIDKATPFDVEIVGSWLFFYSRIPFDLLDGSVFLRIFDILCTLGGKVIGQSSRYVAERHNPRLSGRMHVARATISGLFPKVALAVAECLILIGVVVLFVIQLAPH